MSTIPAPTDALFERIDDRFPRSLERLFRVLRQPSVSATGEGVEACARLLEEWLRELDCEVRDLSVRGAPLLLARRPVAPELPTVLFYGHYDVQPPDPVEAWTSPPFTPTVRDGRVFARGAGDNKGQFTCHLLALEAFRDAGLEPPVNVAVLLDGEEEMGSPNLADAVRAHREALAADVVITADGPYHESGRPLVTCGVRGVLYVELRARGARRDLHSGHFGGIAPLPALRLVRCLRAFLDDGGQPDFPGFLDAVREPSAADRRALDALPFEEETIAAELGLARLPDLPGVSPLERVMFRPHFNLAGLRSGYGGEGAKTVLPCEAVAKIDVRLVPDQDPDRLFEAMREHLARSGFPDVSIEKIQAVPPSRTPVSHPFVDTVRRAVGRSWGEPPLVYPALGATLPDHVFTRELGLPSLFVPYANPDECNHAPDENLEIEAFRRGIRTSAAILVQAALDRGGKERAGGG